MIYILIPFKNCSERLEGKNLMLFNYTLDWLRKELRLDDGVQASPPFGEDVKICTFGCLESRYRRMIEKHGIEHVRLKFYEDKSHLGALKNTLKKLEVKPWDKIIQLQLTQPARRRGLLLDTIKALQSTEKPLISASRVALDNRLINEDGRRFLRQPDDLLLYDGAIYGGTLDNFENWFDLKKASEVIVNQEYSVCDIDTEEDLLNHIKFVK